MRKNAAKMVTCLVSAHDVDPVETHLFVCTFDLKRWNTPEQALRAAWKIWARREDLTTFIERNGTNWGDSTFIPNEVLRLVGISKYENAKVIGRGTKSIRLPRIDMEIDVDHNESLFDLEHFEADPADSRPVTTGTKCGCCGKPADREYVIEKREAYCRHCFKECL
jgi:hypothetical protein